MKTPKDKLREFILSVSWSDVTTAMNAVLGSLVMTCTDADIGLAIEIAKERLAEEKKLYEKSPEEND